MQQLIYGRSRAFASVLETLDGYAVSPWPVLLLGETGTGKELLARRVHALSPRRSSPFLPVNCGAMPPSLFESELFGHEKGAFSGADTYSKGIFRAAMNGTVFLDEIGELEPVLQVKLLRFLDSGEVRTVGGTRVDRIDVRIIAATNVDLTAAVSAGRFRHDLLERLSVLTVEVPPLRDRQEDIPIVAADLLTGIECRFEPDALLPLARCPWPGNVRQLRNFLVRAAVRSRGYLTRAATERFLREDCALLARPEPLGPAFLNGSLAEIEKQVIVARLKRCHGNRKKTAEALGIAKSTLHEKLRKWSYDDGDDVPDDEGAAPAIGAPPVLDPLSHRGASLGL